MIYRKPSEADIAYRFYCSVYNVIRRGLKVRNIEYSFIVPEYPVGKGFSKKRADFVIFAKLGDSTPIPFLVVEVERMKLGGRGSHLKEGMEQAKGCARILGAPFFAVLDGLLLQLYRTTTSRKIAEFDMKMTEDFVEEFLRRLAEVHYNV